MSFLNSTTWTRPDQTHRPLGSPTSPRTLSGRRLVRSISTCTDFVRGSGLVGSQTKSVGPCNGIWPLVCVSACVSSHYSIATRCFKAKFHYTDPRTRGLQCIRAEILDPARPAKHWARCSQENSRPPYPCRPLPRTLSVLQFFQGPHGVTDPTRPTDKVRTCRD